MKKLFCLIFAISMVCSVSFATTTNVSFGEPNEEIMAKIEDAIIADQCITFDKCYWPDDQPEPYPVSEIVWVNVIAKVNDNYVISYYAEPAAVDGWVDIVLGDYMIEYYVYGYAVYSSESDKLLTYSEAYEAGILNNDVFYDIWKHYEKPDKPMTNNITRIGDINRDGNINITDVVICRNSIVNNSKFDDERKLLLSDLNKDGKVSIVDVVIMRHLIVNG